jgi:ubiquinone/menaquinone biosynthesis C-methylase UbiE
MKDAIPMTQSVPFDRAADFYDATRGFPPGIEAQAAATIAQAGHLNSESHVLEIGIGTGRIALPLAGHVRRIEGVDLSEPMLRRLHSKQGDETIRVVVGDVTRLPLAAATVDAVIAVHVFHLVGDYHTALNEAARVLKPGGLLIHAFGDNERTSTLDEVWRAATGGGRGADVGMPWAKRRTVAEDNGWSLREERTVEYEVRRSPAQYVQQARDRCWSSTWRMSDEALAEAIRAVEAYIAQQYADPHEDEIIPSRFIARAYAPPSAKG